MPILTKPMKKRLLSSALSPSARQMIVDGLVCIDYAVSIKYEVTKVKLWALFLGRALFSYGY